jgi:hypothetical protein
LEDFRGILGRKGLKGAAFCGYMFLRVVRTEGTGQVEQVQAEQKNHMLIGKHSPGTLPFPVLQQHEIFRLLDAAHPSQSPPPPARITSSFTSFMVVLLPPLRGRQGRERQI